ncbi:hypothetical protein TNCV_4495881 [Trichonephila clavipes]|nr:hypothetical protein TNCV_4495881 [Trichonephila clavipes]
MESGNGIAVSLNVQSITEDAEFVFEAPQRIRTYIENYKKTKRLLTHAERTKKMRKKKKKTSIHYHETVIFRSKDSVMMQRRIAVETAKTGRYLKFKSVHCRKTIFMQNVDIMTFKQPLLN